MPKKSKPVLDVNELREETYSILQEFLEEIKERIQRKELQEMDFKQLLLRAQGIIRALKPSVNINVGTPIIANPEQVKKFQEGDTGVLRGEADKFLERHKSSSSSG